MIDLSTASGYFRALVETVSVSGFSYCLILSFSLRLQYNLGAFAWNIR